MSTISSIPIFLTTVGPKTFLSCISYVMSCAHFYIKGDSPVNGLNGNNRTTGKSPGDVTFLRFITSRTENGHIHLKDCVTRTRVSIKPACATGAGTNHLFGVSNDEIARGVRYRLACYAWLIQDTRESRYCAQLEICMMCMATECHSNARVILQYLCWYI